MNKKFKRNKKITNKISYGRIGKKNRKFDLESETIKEKRNSNI